MSFHILSDRQHEKKFNPDPGGRKQKLKQRKEMISVSNKIKAKVKDPKVKDPSVEIANEALVIFDEVVEANKDTDKIVVLGVQPEHDGSGHVLVGTCDANYLRELVKTLRPIAFGWRNKVFHITEQTTEFDGMKLETAFPFLVKVNGRVN
jgi:hypothetical protein